MEERLSRSKGRSFPHNPCPAFKKPLYFRPSLGPSHGRPPPVSMKANNDHRRPTKEMRRIFFADRPPVPFGFASFPLDLAPSIANVVEKGGCHANRRRCCFGKANRPGTASCRGFPRALRAGVESPQGQGGAGGILGRGCPAGGRRGDQLRWPDHRLCRCDRLSRGGRPQNRALLAHGARKGEPFPGDGRLFRS